MFTFGKKLIKLTSKDNGQKKTNLLACLRGVMKVPKYSVFKVLFEKKNNWVHLIFCVK